MLLLSAFLLHTFISMLAGTPADIFSLFDQKPTTNVKLKQIPDSSIKIVVKRLMCNSHGCTLLSAEMMCAEIELAAV